MASSEYTAVVFERAMEQLRQEREVFDQAKSHERQWFRLRLVMGYCSVLLLGIIMVVASYIIFNSMSFSTRIVLIAACALFADVLGLLTAVWKIVLNPAFYARLAPVTQIDLEDTGAEQQEQETATAEPQSEYKEESEEQRPRK